MKWYKRDPDAALAGMIGLSLEERAIYNTVIDLLYSRDGDLPTDDTFFARACGCRPQVWRRVRDSLLAKGKLHFKTDGKLTANRVENELQTAGKLITKMAVLGKVSSEKRKQNNAEEPTQRQLHPQPQPQPDKKETEDARTREAPPALISPQAHQLADDCLAALGFSARDPPEGWHGLAYQTQVMVARGYDRETTVATFARIGPLKPMSYHIKAAESANADRANSTVIPLTPKTERTYATPRDGSLKSALARLGEQADRLAESALSEGGEDAPRLLSHGRSE